MNPSQDIVYKCASFMTHPERATPEDIKRMAARLLDSAREAPHLVAESVLREHLVAMQKMKKKDR